jgi:hypothetical protein
VNIPGKSIFYVLSGIALAAVAVLVFCTANSTGFPPLDFSGRLVRAEARRKTRSFSIDSEQVRVMGPGPLLGVQELQEFRSCRMGRHFPHFGVDSMPVFAPDS